MISVHRWSHATKQCESLPANVLEDDPDSLRSTGDVVWIDLANPTDEEERLVFEEFFPVHPLTLEDVTKRRREPDVAPHFPKAEEFEDYLFVVVNPLADRFLETIRKGGVPPRDPEESLTAQFSGVLTHHLLITHHYQPVAGTRELEVFLTRHGSQAERGPDYLFHLILDSAVDEYAFALDHLDDTLDELEVKVLRRSERSHLPTLLSLKREVIAVRKALVYQREVLARLARGEFDLIDEREMVYYRNVYDHLVRFAELAEGSREAVGDLMQAHFAVTSNRLNETMRALTIVSTTILPLTLVAGIYGMNFEHQPEYTWRLGYAWALGLMAALAGTTLLLFRWKKWI